jgi:hypothetical protein
MANYDFKNEVQNTNSRRQPMARGSKAKYTSKQKRMARHIEDSEKKSGRSGKRAAAIGWATVNKASGGAGKKMKNKGPMKKGGRKGGKAAAGSKRTMTTRRRGGASRETHASM